MTILLFIVSASFSIFAQYTWSNWLALVIPVYMLFFNCLAVWTRPSQINLDKLHNHLSPNWSNADKLSVYMKKHWIALEHAPYTSKVAFRLGFVALGSAGLAVYFFYVHQILISGLLAVSTVVLYFCSVQVNRPLASFQGLHKKGIVDPRLLEELSLSASALVAYSELFPDRRISKLVAGLVLETEIGRYIIKLERLKPLQV